ncbi:phenylalanine--tRNA ligase subunit beta [Kocuria sp. p3-SID1433]|uniref:phenylalanine--tRNA ligase subunit beta n=1 Tax=unclassified Kocuria TaxID=2649579 RepID=UPI0021A423DF|nr:MULTISPECIES: phenylalanine--tRNA ligase subunit beta [unclassified Kocuria]MCT1601837.1 phenylalanine--tRNA ligase subunit beta [Kocuria sp. p3-SID1428]MCT2179983.1 phenylalanine--tRNA ligase subunit beta [Kocuria sp. p3-SID1433]
MRVPLSWLREFAPLPEEATAEQLLETMVSVGFEEEEVIRPGDELSGPIVVGQVLSREPEKHSNGKTVNWCLVRVVPEGQEQTLTGKGIDPSGVQGIVCGAHNFEVGDKVVVTLPGAVLPGDFRISPRKTYGHTSAGMIASARELGIGDDHDGILVLGDLGLDPQPGTDVRELLHLDESAADLNVTPDRGYALSMRGMAREYCHAVGASFADPVIALAEAAPEPTESAVPVVLADESPIHGEEGCSRFVTRVVRGIDPSRPTPVWMAARLRLAGVRSISLPVDISNYVMLELGQPLHFYDLSRVAESITVRRARQGERLTTLDGKDRGLDPEDLLIADATGPIGLAGTMGGEFAEVGDQTVDVLVEAARFDPVSIARTARRHRLSSEASRRFERGVDPQLQAAAAERAVELLVELAGGTAGPEVGDVRTEDQPVQEPIRLRADYPARRVGVDYSSERVESLLEEIGCTLETLSPAAEVAAEPSADLEDGWLVTPPSWRPDLVAAEDLAEEIARLDGYDRIPSRLPVAPPGRGLSTEQVGRRRVLDALAAAGLTEVLSYPFVAPADNELWAVPEAGTPVASVRLANPISEARGVLRASLIPGMLEILHRNRSRGFRDLQLFESGLVFRPNDQLGTAGIPPVGQLPSAQTLEDLRGGIPQQPRHLAAVFAGDDALPAPGLDARSLGWQDALDTARLVGDVLGVQLTLEQGRHQAFHPGRTAVLRVPSGDVVGTAGELHPQLVAQQGLPERTSALELDLSAIQAARTGVVTAQILSVQTPATQDVALVVDASLPASELLSTVREGAGDLVEDVRVFDVYQGEHIEAGKKSVALAMRFRAPDRTLTAEEASQARTAAVELAESRHGAALRG